MMRYDKPLCLGGAFILLTCFCSILLQQGESLQEEYSTENKASMRGSRGSKPLFVLHVGPPKTGTTTIQHFANTSQDLLAQDNFFYLGTTNYPKTKHTHELVRNCRDGVHPDCKDKWNEFKGIVNDHYQQNHNVLMSEEMLNICASEEDEQEYLWDHLLPLLNGWNVRIAFTYRHLCDWIPSKYYQAHNFKVIPRLRPVVENWPDNGGRIIGSFSEYFDEFMKRPFHLPLPVKRRWAERFSDIRVLDMDNSTNILRDFFCEVMPEAEQLCTQLENDPILVEHVNPSSDHVIRFDMLAVEAYQRKWIDDSLSRKDVSHAAEVHAQQIGYYEASDFPLDCLSREKTDSLFQDTLEYAREMFPKVFSTPSGEQELLVHFREAIDEGKFCTVDVNETLKLPKWKNFFKNLSRNNIHPEDSS